MKKGFAMTAKIHKVTDGLVRARKLLEDPANWLQGRFVERYMIDGVVYQRYCIVAALELAIPERAWSTLAEAKDIISGYVPAKYGTVEAWNDSLGTKHEDVLRVLDLAIEEAREEDR